MSNQKIAGLLTASKRRLKMALTKLERMNRWQLTSATGKNLILIILELAIIFPIIWIFSASIRSYSSLLTTTLQIIPSNPTIAAYYWALALDSPFWTALFNSLLVCLSTTGICILIASPAAYAMSRFKFLGKQPILYALIFIQFVPGILMFIAFFWLLFALGLYDNLFGLILIYVSLVLPFNIWNLKAFFDTIPKDIDEAALIDGATYLGAMVNVVLPLSAPGLAVTAFFSFLTGWNEFALANIVLGSESNYTVPLRLYFLSQREFSTNWPHFAALSILSSIPIVIVFIYLQRYLRAGLAIGAVKG
jgi:arabinogalactan oligomer/maltooligosaccharide transport system permease protein